MRHPNELDETQHKELALIRQVSPSAEAAYCLAQAFMQMIREQTGHQLEAWLGEAEASCLPEFQSFAKGIQQDKAAVFVGLTLPWSNGPLEGHVNRLKLLKRSMYGRARLPLLRARVLHVDGSAKPSHADLRAAG
jgi:transposase